jgi:putative intracellular protease/amidase
MIWQYLLGISMAAGTLAATTPALHRPVVIAVVGDSAGTEITDFMIPRAVLSGIGSARVVSVASTPAPIRFLENNLSLRPDLTFAEFDRQNPEGAAYVIVPAMADRENTVVAAWLRAQAERGATIVSICDGAWTVANAGLFEGRRATSHWHSMSGLAERYPSTAWMRDARYVVDDRVISTTGVTASLPVSIYLIDRIAGRAVADSAAAALGLSSWDAHHQTSDFGISKWMYTKAVFNYFASWRHERVTTPVEDGVDEIALAFTVDAIPRTVRADARVVAIKDSIIGKRGLTLHIERNTGLPQRGKILRVPSSPSYPVAALDSAISRLGSWYGKDAASLIATGMEYPNRRKAQ